METTDKRITVLLVDDEEQFRGTTARLLARRGFDTIEAESGEQALMRLRESLPDAVLLDLRMPGMDGIEVLRELRGFAPDLPVIILTGHGGIADALTGIRLEITEFLQKPVDVERLAARIRELLRRGGRPLQEKTIAELMVPVDAFRRVYMDQRFEEAVRVLRDSFFPSSGEMLIEPGHRSVLVFDRKERFVGMLRIRDAIRALLPDEVFASPYSSGFTGMFLAQSKLIGKRPVAELIDEPVTIGADEPLMEAVLTMMARKLINLPVMRQGTLVGVLRDKELFLELAAAVAGE